MARPVKGLWASQNIAVAEATNVWGTGINPVHTLYGEGPPERISGREGATSGLAPGVAGVQFAPITPAAEGAPGYIEGPDYGYTPEDIAGLDVFASPLEATHGKQFHQDGWPDWGQETSQTRAKADPKSVYPVGSAGRIAERIRSLRFGPMNGPARTSNQIPVETVTEGWRNKATSHIVADSEPSDPSQYERQTSMQQRYRSRVNDAAVARGTDEPRAEIKSRVAPQIEKVYSGQDPHSERAYDMFPYQQDQINRPFRYRTAGTGYQEWMEVNEMQVIQAMRRTPPSDPSAGIPETGDQMDYGYTEEDNFYA